MPDKPYLSIREVCERLGVDYKTIYRQIQAGALPASKIGGVYRIREEDVADYIARRRAQPATAVPSPTLVEAALAGERIEPARPEELRDMAADRLSEAGQRLRDGEIDVLVTTLIAKQRETSAINRFDRKLRELVSVRLPAPAGGLPASAVVRITNPDRSITRADHTDELMRVLNTGYLERSMVDRLPINPSERLTLLSQERGADARPLLVIEMALWSDLAAHARHGFAERRLALEDLLPRLNQAAAQAESAGAPHILGLASTAGWAESAVHFVDAPGEGGQSYTHRLLMPVLVDLTRSVALYDRRDPRIEPFVGLFSPVLRDERVAAAARAIEEALLIHDSLALEELPRVCGAEPDIAQAAAARLLDGGKGKYTLQDIAGLGPVLSPAR